MSFIDLIRKLNRDRLIAKKARHYSKDDIPSRRNFPLPQKVQKVLILHFQPGWGDFLYLSGLVESLTNNGFQITLATPPNLVSRLQHISPDVKVWDATNPPPEHNLDFDCIVDIDWVVGKDHCLTMVKSIKCRAITCSIVLSKLNLYDQYIDFSQTAHMSDRYAMIVSALTRKKSPPVLPHISFTKDELSNADSYLTSKSIKEKHFIYLNTEGSDDDRKFSKGQIFDIVQTTLKLQIPIVYYCPKYDIRQEFSESASWLFPLPHGSFFEAAAIISRAAAIITPDTSIVHLASAFNIPVMAVFCEGDYDYFGKYHLSEVWSPRSTVCLTVDSSSSPTKKKTRQPIPIYKLPINFSLLTKNFIDKLISESTHE